MNKIDVSYVTNLPLIGDAPRVTVNANPKEQFTILFKKGNDVIKEVKCVGGETITANRQWFTNWTIEVYKDGILYDEDKFNPRGEIVFVKMDAYALGDSIAWIQAVEDFRRQKNNGR